MAVAPQTPAFVRFGVYEADMRAHELRKKGVRVKLQEQPFQVLTVLLEHAGQVVTREELRARIWSDDTFVDFDNSLNTSINKLREALNDSAESPRYIETVPRRGYRFIAPLVKGAEQNLPGWGGPLLRGWKFWGGAAIVLVGLVLGLLLWKTRTTRLTEKDTLVLADFVNTTGEPVFDDALKQGLRAQLEQSPFLNILSDEQVSGEVSLMERPKDERLTKELAREVCLRSGSKAVLAGSIARLGAHYAIGLRAFDCNAGTALGSEQAEADSKEDVLRTLGAAARKMRQKLGESLVSVQKYDKPVEQATTRSLDALKAYSLGLKTWSVKGVHGSLPFFKRAVELDSKFAMAYGRMAVAYSMTGDWQLSAENMRKAFDLRDSVSERERFYLESHYYDTVTGEWDKAAQSYELWQQVYPRDPSPHDNLQNVYSYLGEHEKALMEGLENLRLRPNSVIAYEDTCYSYLALNRPREAQTVLQQAERLQLQSPHLLACRYEVAVLKKDFREADRLLEIARTSSALPWILAEKALLEAQLGRLQKSRELSKQALEYAENRGASETGAYLEANAGLIEAYLGNWYKARTHVAAAQKLTENRQSQPLSAYALALLGDIQAAEKETAELNRRWPLDTLVQRYWLPVIRAAVSLHNKQTERALDLLRVTRSYELSTDGHLDATYLCGQVYLDMGNGSAAAEEFRKILQHPGLVLSSPVGALTHLGLARAYALEGHSDRSRAAYQDVFALWRDADPDIPVLQQAKVEYAKLQ